MHPKVLPTPSLLTSKRRRLCHLATTTPSEAVGSPLPATAVASLLGSCNGLVFVLDTGVYSADKCIAFQVVGHLSMADDYEVLVGYLYSPLNFTPRPRNDRNRTLFANFGKVAISPTRFQTLKRVDAHSTPNSETRWCFSMMCDEVRYLNHYLKPHVKQQIIGIKLKKSWSRMRLKSIGIYFKMIILNMFEIVV